MKRLFCILASAILLCTQSFAEIKTYKYVYSVNPLTGEKTQGKSYLKYMYFSSDKSNCYEVDAQGKRKGQDLSQRYKTTSYFSTNDYYYQTTKNNMIVYKCRVIYEQCTYKYDPWSMTSSYTVTSHDEWDIHVYFSPDYKKMNMPNRHTGNLVHEYSDTPIDVYVEYTPDSQNGVQNHLW